LSLSVDVSRGVGWIIEESRRSLQHEVLVLLLGVVVEMVEVVGGDVDAGGEQITFRMKHSRVTEVAVIVKKNGTQSDMIVRHSVSGSTKKTMSCKGCAPLIIVLCTTSSNIMLIGRSARHRSKSLNTWKEGTHELIFCSW
jgi:hypothetical protein